MVPLCLSPTSEKGAARLERKGKIAERASARPVFPPQAVSFPRSQRASRHGTMHKVDLHVETNALQRFADKCTVQRPRGAEKHRAVRGAARPIRCTRRTLPLRRE